MEDVRDSLREAVELFVEAASAEEVERRYRGGVLVTPVEAAVGEVAVFFGNRFACRSAEP